MIAFAFHRDPPSALPIVSIPRIARACSLLKKACQSKRCEIGVSFVSESSITRLNRQYRHINKATDVLSFSSQEGDQVVHGVILKEVDLGDIVICPAFAKREAKRRGIELSEELVRLVIHGTLHLMGYDHADEVSEHRMFRIQETIVEKAMKKI
jgi:probable rRNA maturation factor